MGTQHGGWSRVGAGRGRERGSTAARPRLRLVQWMVTEQCQLACPHCLSAGSSPGPGLTLPEVESFLDELQPLGVAELLLTGGEPTEREDLPEIVGLIARRQLRWSLNTARLPSPSLRAALEAWPPSFVAVSLDGPEETHDRFRGKSGSCQEAIAAIRYVAGRGVPVAAGTTVGRHNFAELMRTFELVRQSGASSWGLHLIVPEGRALRRRDLRLERSELRWLVELVAALRPSFPVGMADEIGYCGPWEPLVRDHSFYCGAGRSMCVVLSDGEVVPCTTTDRSASAGNLRERPLADIWRSGFRELRRRSARASCARCPDEWVCRGGCWLMRRRGEPCLRELWRTPRRMALAGAGLGLAIGACSSPPATAPAPLPGVAGHRGAEHGPPPAAEGASAARPADAAAPDPGPGVLAIQPGAPAQAPATVPLPVGLAPEALLAWWVTRHPWSLCGPSAASTSELRARLEPDPLAAYFASLEAGGSARELAQRAADIKAAAGTQHALPLVAAIWWRDLQEWCLDRSPPEQRTKAERSALRGALATLSAWASKVAVDKLAKTIDVPAPGQGEDDPRCGLYKSGCFSVMLPSPTPAQRRSQAQRHVAKHPPGSSLSLRVEVEPGDGLAVLSAGGRRGAVRGRLDVGAFDVLAVPDGAGARVKLVYPSDTLLVMLPGGAELTLLELARLAHEQHQQAVDADASASIAWLPEALQLAALRAQARGKPPDAVLPEAFRSSVSRSWLKEE